MTAPRNPFDYCLHCRAAGQQVALATVIKTWGSSPYGVGTAMGISGDGGCVGSVSGGCVEVAIISAALAHDGKPGVQVLRFSVSQDDAFDAGLTCGGDLEILLEHEPTTQGLSARAHGQATRIDLSNGDIVSENTEVLGGNIFTWTKISTPHLVVIGAGAIAEALQVQAASLGYTMTLIEPRTGLLNTEIFPGAIDGWPQEVLPDLLSEETAVIALSHDSKIDVPALTAALASPAFYVGALGSLRTQNTRQADLESRGVTVDQLARLSGPIGLDIGAKTSGEIAIAIMAEIISVWRKGT